MPIIDDADDLDAECTAMAADETREAETAEWSEALIGDIANEVS